MKEPRVKEVTTVDQEVAKISRAEVKRKKKKGTTDAIFALRILTEVQRRSEGGALCLYRPRESL